MTPQFFGLLHLDENERTAVNLATPDFDRQANIYIYNAASLAKSLYSAGISFTLLTNDGERVRRNLPSDCPYFAITEIPFRTQVPHGIKFYSAHFKIDALRYIGSLPEGYFVLSDLDVLCVNEVPQALRNIAEAGIPLCYDISDQVISAYGREKIVRDLEMLHGLDSEGRWIGGEFIGGTPKFFQAIHDKTQQIYGRYLQCLPEMRHVGDEVLTAAAAELLRREGLYIADAGQIKIVARYWSKNVRHPQKPLGSYLQDCFLLHLPADKEFLAELALKDTVTPARYGELYLRHWKSLAQTSGRVARRSKSWLVSLRGH